MGTISDADLAACGTDASDAARFDCGQTGGYSCRLPMLVDAHDATLHVDVAGENDPPIILLHGLGGSRLTWAAVAPGLAAARRVVSVDLRGCGKSERGNAPYTLDLLADDVVRVLEAIGATQCHVVGHSLGGVVAQSLLTRHGSRCLSAVLISTSSRVGEKASAGWSRLADVVETRGLSDAPAARTRAFSDEYAQANSSVIDEHAAIAATSDPAVYAAQARAAATYDYTEALGSVDTPVLVIQGLADKLTTPGGSVILSRTLTNSRLEMVEGVGHNAHVEMGERFCRMVLEFCAEAEAREPTPRASGD